MEHTDRDALLNSTEDQSVTSCSSNRYQTVESEQFFLVKVLSVSAHSVAQTLIGATVGVTLWFAFKSAPIGLFQLHVGLCVFGYQLLMSHGILSLRSTSWSSLSVKLRRRVHWILQVSGSLLAVAGTALMIKNKTDSGRDHFTSMHGKLALAALIFTCASLINGTLSLFVVELRHLIPAKVSKISHIILGSAAFVTSSASLAFGFNQKTFAEWASQEFAYVMIAMVVVYTVLIMFLPCYNVLKKLAYILKIKIC